jgi:hypothetical protein
MQRGLSKRPPMKKEATLKNVKEIIQKTSEEKRGNPEKCKGAHQEDLRCKNKQPSRVKCPQKTHPYVA